MSKLPVRLDDMASSMQLTKTREQLRERGQFWTPAWVARAMITFCRVEESSEGIQRLEIFDPAAGKGAFLIAAQEIADERGFDLRFKGKELDASLEDELDEGSSEVQIEYGDYLDNLELRKYKNIVANPPYIRHHRLNDAQKTRGRELVAQVMHGQLDGRAGWHVYFLIKSLAELQKDGRLAFIIPSDIFEGIYARKLWNWICSNYRVHAVATFSPEATPFPGVDTNAAVIFLSADTPSESYIWGRICEAQSDTFEDWVSANFPASGSVITQARLIADFKEIGLNREKRIDAESTVPLGNFLKCMRGIATGANDFFLMTDAERKAKKLPKKYFIHVVGRTRDVEGDTFSKNDIARLEKKERPTMLLALKGKAYQELPKSIQDYLAEGERRGLPDRALIRQRKPWFKMEVRKAPPILFAYLGRRKARFIRNLSEARPLTGFLCVYPDERLVISDRLDNLWELLNEEEVIDNLKLVAKSYGSGAIKVEPRALERTPVPKSLVRKHGLDDVLNRQGRLIAEEEGRYAAAR